MQAPPYAGFWLRFVAFLADILLFLLLGALLVEGALMALHPAGDDARELAYDLLQLAALPYFALFEGSRLQGTPGKLMVGIRVTGLDGARIGFWHAIGRNLGRIISSFLLVGYLAAGLSPTKQAFHDMMARTLVLRKEATGQPPLPADAAKAGAGTRALLVGVVATVVLLSAGGILAGIMVPAYHAYAVRAQVAEGLEGAASLQPAIAQALESGTPPSQVDSTAVARLDARPGRYVDSMSVQYGVIVIHFGKEADPAIRGRDLLVYPARRNEGRLAWICGQHRLAPGEKPVIGEQNIPALLEATDLDPKYLPGACR